MEEKDLGFRFWNLLRDASVNTEYVMTDFSARSKLSRLQCRTLLQIFIQEKVRLSDLALILGMNPGNLSRVCQSLEENSLLQREHSTDDRRVWAISLTEKGQEVIKEIADNIKASFQFFLIDHSEEELHMLLKLWSDYNEYYKQMRQDKHHKSAGAKAG